MLLNCGVGEDSWESLDCKEIQPVHPKGDQPWDFFGRNDAKAETPLLWPPHGKSWLTGKDSDAGRDWGQEEKGTTEDEMAGWHHRLYAHEFEWTLGDGDGQGGLACSDSWGHKELDTTEGLNWTELNILFRMFSLKNISIAAVQSCLALCNPWTAACQVSLSFSICLPFLHLPNLSLFSLVISIYPSICYLSIHLPININLCMLSSYYTQYKRCNAIL